MFHKAWNAPDFPVPSRLGAGPTVPGVGSFLFPPTIDYPIRVMPAEKRRALAT